MTSLLASLILPSPIPKPSLIVYSQHSRQSCPFKTQAGPRLSFTRTSVMMSPPTPTSLRVKAKRVQWPRGPNELTHLQSHSFHLLHPTPFHSDFVHTILLDVSWPCQGDSHLGMFDCAVFSASNSLPTDNIWLHFSVSLAFWPCVI